MKKYITLCLVTFLLFASAAEAQIDYKKLNFPVLRGSQTIKGLVQLKPNGVDKALAYKDDNLVYLNSDVDDANQFWWIVQDYQFDAFSLVHALDNTKWIASNNTGKEHQLAVLENNTEDKDEDGYLNKKFFFNFETRNNFPDKKIAIRSINGANPYLVNYLETPDDSESTEATSPSSIAVSTSDFKFINATKRGGTSINNLFNGSYRDFGWASYHFRRSQAGLDWGMSFKLENPAIITSVKIGRRWECCSDRVNNMVIQVFENGKLKATVSQYNKTDSYQTYTFGNVQGDEIRLKYDSDNSNGQTGINVGHLYTANFTELEVFGSNQTETDSVSEETQLFVSPYKTVPTTTMIFSDELKSLTSTDTKVNTSRISFMNAKKNGTTSEGYLFNGKIYDSGWNTYHFTREKEGQDWGMSYKLGGIAKIDKVNLARREECCTERIKNAIVQIYEKGELKGEISQYNIDYKYLQVYKFDGVQGDEIRIIFDNDIEKGLTGVGSGNKDVANFTELEIYGYEAVGEVIGTSPIQKDYTGMNFLFDIVKFDSDTDDYISVPFYNSPNHTQSKSIFSSTITAKENLITNAEATVVSGHGFVNNSTGDSEMFKLHIKNPVTEGEVGLIDYMFTPFSKTFYQKGGTRKPNAGIRINRNSVTLFNSTHEVSTRFNKKDPIIFGFENGQLYAKQNNEEHVMTGVPTPVLLNSNLGETARLMAVVESGSVEIGYRPKSIFFTEKYNGKDTMDSYSTYPYITHTMHDNVPANSFDWRSENFKLRYKVGGAIRNEIKKSPFFYNDTDPAFKAISAKYDYKGDYLGGEDFYYHDGWELITYDFGYDHKTGLEKAEANLINEPYLILYNRFTGKLRVFVYISNASIANFLRISLINGPVSGVTSKYSHARLWGSYLLGKALDDATLSNNAYSKMVPLKSSSSGRFVFADFILNMDPCVRFYESNFKVKAEKITQGTMKMVGRSMGGSVPTNSPVIDDWLDESDNFLGSAMNTPYGEASQTMGDVSFRNFKEWGKTEWDEKTQFVLPGKKVQDWERKAAKLEYQGTATMSAGDMVSAAGKYIKAVGNAVTDGTFGATSAGLKTAGESIDAAGTALKGAGRSVKAEAARLRWVNLKDQPDKTIQIKTPDPQPSMVFSELALSGTLSITSEIFDNVVISTPGGRGSELAPIHYKNGSKGGFPYYNNEVGVFNMLHQPKLAISIAKRGTNVGANIRLKNKLYLVANKNIYGRSMGIFSISAVVTTYDSRGKSKGSLRSRPYLFTSDIPKDSYEVLPDEMDISSLVDKLTLAESIGEKTSITLSELNKWIQVEYEVDYLGFNGKDYAGTYGAQSIRQSFMSDIKEVHFTTQVSENSKPEDVAKLNGIREFADYNGADSQVLGSKYIILNNNENNSKIEKYCSSTIFEEDNSYASRLAQKFNNEKTLSTDISEEDIENDNIPDDMIIVYPNRVIDYFQIAGIKNYKEVQITLFDVNGRKVKSYTRQNVYDIQDLVKGIYILTLKGVNNDNQKVQEQFKILVEH